MSRNEDERIQAYTYLFGVQRQRAGQIINEVPNDLKPAFMFFHLIKDLDKLKELVAFLKKETNELNIKLKWQDGAIKVQSQELERIELKIGDHIYWTEKVADLSDDEILEEYLNAEDYSYEDILEEQENFKKQDEESKYYISYKEKLLCEKAIQGFCKQEIDDELFEKILHEKLTDHDSIVSYIFETIEKNGNFISYMMPTIFNIPKEYCIEYGIQIITRYVQKYEKLGRLD